MTRRYFGGLCGAWALAEITRRPLQECIDTAMWARERFHVPAHRHGMTLHELVFAFDALGWSLDRSTGWRGRKRLRELPAELQRGAWLLAQSNHWLAARSIARLRHQARNGHGNRVVLAAYPVTRQQEV